MLRRAQLQVIVGHLRALPDEVVERLDGQERALLDAARGEVEANPVDVDAPAALVELVVARDDGAVRLEWPEAATDRGR